jgi:ABC-type transport system substrate-binding protein
MRSPASTCRACTGPASAGSSPPGMPGHVPDLADRFDPDEAARLLAASGAGEGPPVRFIGGERWRVLETAWRAVGLPCELYPAEPSEWADAWDSAPAGRAVVGGWWADYPDPDNFLRVCVQLNLERWPTERYGTLIEHAARKTDQAERLAAYREAEMILADEAVVVPLAYGVEHLMLKPWVTQYPTVAVKHPGFWKDVRVERG